MLRNRPKIIKGLLVAVSGALYAVSSLVAAADYSPNFKNTEIGEFINIVGKNLKKKGLYNNMPDLQNLDKNGDIKYKVDFREVYATILNNWLKVDDEKVLNKSFSKLNFI